MDSTAEKESQRPKFGILCPINTNTFPGKLWKLVNDENYRSVAWNHTGSGININAKLFKTEVLHSDDFSMFKTQNFSSFVRQLNLYGFRKLTISSKPLHGQNDKKVMQVHQFQHPCFMRSRPDMLSHVKRAGSRKKTSTREYTFGSEPDISPTMVPRRSASSHYFPSWSAPSTSNIGTSKLGRSAFSLPERVNRNMQLSQKYNYDYEALSPVRDIIRPTLFPPLILPEDQHPFRRADSDLPCPLSMTWMGNIAEGSLTSSELGATSPEILMEHGKLRRFVVVPDDTVGYLSRLQIPSNDFLERFRPMTHQPENDVPVPTIQTPMVSPAPVHCQTAVSWSNTTPVVTAAQQKSVFWDSLPKPTATSTGNARSEESGERMLLSAVTPMYAKNMSAMEEGNDEDEPMIVIKVELEGTP